MIVAIVGASPNPERYSNRAQRQLDSHGHQVIAVTPNHAEVLGVTTHPDLKNINQVVDTVTLYLRPERQLDMVDDLIALKPRRVIFNPGSENAAVETRCRQAGISVERACTLVLLSTGQFAPDSSAATSTVGP